MIRRLCEHCGVVVATEVSGKMVRHDPASNKDAQKREDGACLGSGRIRYWDALCPDCDAQSYSLDVAFCRAHYEKSLRESFKTRTGYGIAEFRALVQKQLDDGAWDRLSYYAQRITSNPGSDLVLKTWEALRDELKPDCCDFHRSGGGSLFKCGPDLPVRQLNVGESSEKKEER